MAAQDIGTHSPVVGSHTLLLDDPARAVLIEAGSADVFVVRMAGDVPQGARQHLCTLGAGALLLGVAPGLDDHALLAVAWDGARLRPVSLKTGIAELPDRRVVARGVDAWLEGVTAGLARYLVHRPRPDLLVRAGEQVPAYDSRAGGGDRIIAARAGVVWLRGADATTLLSFGLQEAAEGSSPMAPVTQDGWVRGRNTRPLLSLTTIQVLATPAGWNALRTTNHTVLAVASTLLSLALVDEHHRLTAKQRNEQRALRGAVETAVEVIGDRPPLDSGVAASDDRLFMAAQRVARAAGMQARRPIRVREADADVPPTLAQIAHASRFRIRRVTLPDGWWRCPTLGPMLGSDTGGRPRALLPDGGGFILYDPVDGREWPVTAELAADMGRVAHVFMPTFPDADLKTADVLLFGLGLCRDDLAVLVLATLVSALLGMTVPLATAYLFDAVIPGRMTGELWQLGTVLVVVALTNMVIRMAGEIARLRIDIRLGERIQSAMLDRLLRLPARFFATVTVGDLASRVAAASSLQAGVRRVVADGAVSLAIMMGSLVLMLLLDPLVAGLSLGLVALQLAAASVTAWLQMNAFRNGDALAGLADGLLLQVLTGITKLRLAAAENRAFVRWSERFMAMRRRSAAARRVSNGYEAFLSGFAPLSTAALFLVVAHAADQPAAAGTFVAIIAAFGVLMAAAGQMARLLLGASMLRVTVAFARPILQARPEPTVGRIDPGPLEGGVDVNDLAFRYGPDEPPVFNGLSFHVAAGEMVAVVGTSGCGKSTLVRLLLGLETPARGAILYDGQDLRSLDLGAVRRQVGTVLQDGRLLPGSIFETIRGESDITLDQAWTAACAAGLEDDLRKMPMGLHTVVTDGGVTLSGGQVQRILIARALAARPALLFLDEATSALDNVTQAHVMASLRQLTATRLVIAHRLSTIRDASRILVLEGGRVVEQGGFAELVEANGTLTRLVKSQSM